MFLYKEGSETGLSTQILFVKGWYRRGQKGMIVIDEKGNKTKI